MAERPPNILLVIADDQRFDTIHALGCSRIATPALDRLVERGTAFTQAHRAGCGHPDVGASSRAALHAGRAAGCGAEHTLLGEHLGRHGYRSWAAGKWPNGCESFQRSFQGGAEIFFGTIGDPWNLPVCDYDPSGRYAGRLPVVPGFASSNAVWMRQADRVTPGRHSTELFCDAAVELLKRVERARPFFLYLSLMAPHDPRTMPAKYLYDAEGLELPPNWLPGHPFDNGELDGRDEQLAAAPRDEEEIRRHVAEYYAMISHLDAEVGRVLAEVEWQGLAAETVVAFASDSGLALGQHGLMGKRSLYEHSMRVPLLLSGPGVPRGERRDALCSLADLFPTLCHLAGLPSPPTVDGASLVPLLRDAAATGRDGLYLAQSSLHRAIKEPGLKLIETVVAGGRMTQLFDLARDPWERENLAGRPGKQETVARMRERLFAMRDALGDRETPEGAAFWDGYESPGGCEGLGLSLRSPLRDLLDDPASGEAIAQAIGPAMGGARMRGLLDFSLEVAAAWHPELFGTRTMEAIAAALDRARLPGAGEGTGSGTGGEAERALGGGDSEADDESSGEPLEARSGE